MTRAWLDVTDVSRRYATSFDNLTLTADRAPRIERSVALEPLSAEEAHPELGLTQIGYDGGTDQDRGAEFNSDGLRFWLRNPYILDRGIATRGRVQLDMVQNRNVHRLDYSVSMRLSGGFSELVARELSVEWITIAEFWNNPTWVGGAEYPFRISVNLIKAKGSHQPLVISVTAQRLEPDDDKFQFMTIWRQVAAEPMLFDQWVNLRYHLLEGKGDAGRFFLGMTYPGGKELRLVDVRGDTCHPDDPAPDGFTHFNPLKLYTAARTLRGLQQPLIIDWGRLSMDVAALG